MLFLSEFNVFFWETNSDKSSISCTVSILFTVLQATTFYCIFCKFRFKSGDSQEFLLLPHKRLSHAVRISYPTCLPLPRFYPQAQQVSSTFDITRRLIILKSRPFTGLHSVPVVIPNHNSPWCFQSCGLLIDSVVRTTVHNLVSSRGQGCKYFQDWVGTSQHRRRSVTVCYFIAFLHNFLWQHIVPSPESSWNWDVCVGAALT